MINMRFCSASITWEILVYRFHFIEKNIMQSSACKYRPLTSSLKESLVCGKYILGKTAEPWNFVGIRINYYR